MPRQGAMVDEREAAGELERPIDCPRLFKECSSCVFLTCAVLLFLAAAGLERVDPPGEEELCQVKTLGLEDQRERDQTLKIHACEALYLSVFAYTRTIAIIFVAVAVLCPVLLFVLAEFAKRSEKSTRLYVTSTVIGIFWAVCLWVPSGWFLGMSAIVTAITGPITAQWLIIYSVYFGTKAVGEVPPHWMEVIYKAYGACWYMDASLWLGSVCMVVLAVSCIADAIRNISATCKPPHYDNRWGTEVCRLRRKFCSVRRFCRRCCGGGSPEAGYSEMPR